MPAATIARDDDPSSPILTLDSFPSTGKPVHKKLTGYDLYHAMKSPKHIVAPMVDQSELPWRILSRRYNSHLVYTPMINARAFLHKVKSSGPEQQSLFWISEEGARQEEGEEAVRAEAETIGSDRPLIVQFAGHDSDTLLAAAQVVEQHCDAVDLNLGCPQDIARRGRYGSFLQSDWQLIFQLINKLHINLRIPVTAKMRVFESTERTVAYALMMEKAGAQIITVHGRTREMKGHKTGLADWEKIRAVKEAVRVPVFANGNILFREDVARALKATGADGVMSAEGNLYNPALFTIPPEHATELYPLAPIYPFPRLAMLIKEYLNICDRLDTPTASSAIKSHIFRLARPALEIHRDLRPTLGMSHAVPTAKGRHRHEPFHTFLLELSSRLEQDEKMEQYLNRLSNTALDFESTEGQDPVYIPHWLAQPYYRKSLPPVEEGEEAKQARREKRALRVEQTDRTTTIEDIQTEGESSRFPYGDGDFDIRLKTILEEAKTIKETANALFEKKQHDDAILRYTDVLSLLPPRRAAEEDEDKSYDEGEPSISIKGKEKEKEVVLAEPSEVESSIQNLRAIVYANLAACHLARKSYPQAVVACNESLQDDPLYLKALNRRAQANEEIGTWSSMTSSLEDYRTISSMPHPASLQPALTAALNRLPGKISIASEKEKAEMMGKLKGIGDSVLGFFGLSTDNFQLQKGEGGGYSVNFVR